MTKRQRQNLSKRQEQKAAKASDEVQRLDTYAKHKREQDAARLAEQLRPGRKISGGMKASVDDRGKLVWE
jgi:hypothetical protein